MSESSLKACVLSTHGITTIKTHKVCLLDVQLFSVQKSLDGLHQGCSISTLNMDDSKEVVFNFVNT